MNKKHIKVVHYRSTFLPLTETWIYNQVLGLDNIAVRFYAIARKNKGSFPFDNLRCLEEDMSYFPLRFNKGWNRCFNWYPQLLVWFWRDRPQLIHAHFGPCGCEILPYAKMLNIPLITSFYGRDAYLFKRKEPYWQKRYKELFKYGSLFLAEGPAMRKKLIELGCSSEKIAIHHIGITPEKYEFRAREANNEIRLMTCGRFMEKKGIPYAIEALQRLRSRAELRVRLTIVGDSDSKRTLTDEKRKILNSIEKYGLADVVKITGFIPHNEVLRVAYDHHLFLAPSIHASSGDAEGGFPVILTEVLATGMPVVAFSHCDIPQIIQNGKSGFLVPEKDVDALIERIEYLIRHPAIWGEMARNGRKFVEEEYDIKKLNRRLVEIYENIAEANNKHSY